MPDYSYENIDRSIEQLTHAIDFCDKSVDVEELPDGTYQLSQLTAGKIYRIPKNVTCTIVYKMRIYGSTTASATSDITVRPTYTGTTDIIVYTNGDVQIGTKMLYFISSGVYKSFNGNYLNLIDVPSINGVPLLGNKTTTDLHIGGGGTSDYTDLTNKPQINDVTLSGNKTSSDLGLQGELTAGTGIQIANDVITANGRPIKFVQSLPLSNIDTTAVYNISNDSIFPEVASWAGASNDCVIVTYDANNGYKLLWLESNRTGDNFKYTNYYGETRNYHYKIFHAGNTSWVEDINSTGTDYMTAFGIVWNTVIYSNYNIRNGDGAGDTSGKLKYSKENNQTDIYGVPLNGTATYQFRTYQYINNAWVLLGISDYSDLFSEVLAELAALENPPREPYTPEAQTVDFLDLADGKVYDAMDDFTLARYSGQTVVTSIDVHAGDIFSVGEYNSTDGYSMIALFCNQGVFSFQSNISDWSNGYLPNAHDLYSSLAVKVLPTDNNACNVSTLADGVYFATQTTTLTGWVSGTLNVSENTEIIKTNDVLVVNNSIYTDYDLTNVTKHYVEASDIVQTTGQYTDKVVSQAAWTNNLGLEVL